jgi:DNA invertase Pin-like site-specific DNA recombinase
LEQSFNSLDAQREACEAFILSQRHEGWRVVPARYDDGGYSGGNMDRPALKQLLEDIAAQKIDTVVVYKVDRLTRSLSDFAKIIETLDARETSFVSVTQQFNTTTSMGRLTLNILLSFAQFEREVTGERIRDKIAASKRRGMWMGGNVPLGYDAKDRKLIVNPEEAKSVRRIFSLYLKLGCVSKLKARLDHGKAKSKLRTNPSGKKTGGVPHSRGALYKILNNPIYLGQICHKGQCYPGEHQAILPRKLWDQVQAELHGHNQGRRTGVKAVSPSLLVGLLWDSEGNKLTPSHALKDGKRYRYYCRAVSQGAPPPGNSVRLPAHDIESRVLRSLACFLESQSRIMDRLVSPEDEADVIEQLFLSARRLAPTFRSAKDHLQTIELVRKIVYRVVIYPDKVEVLLRRQNLRQLLGQKSSAAGTDGLITLVINARLGRRGGDVRLVVALDRALDGAEPAPQYQSQPLLKALARAQDWHERLVTGRASGPRAIATQTGLDEGYVRRILGHAFLAPDIVQMIVDGRQPQGLTLEKLRMKLPLSWEEQKWLLLHCLPGSKSVQ